MPVSKTLTQCLFHKCVIDYFYLQQTRCKEHSFLYVLGFGKRLLKNVLFLCIRLKINLSRRFDLYISTPFIVSFLPCSKLLYLQAAASFLVYILPLPPAEGNY